MNFTERRSPDTKITVMPQRVPHVLIDKEALQKMFIFTDECSDEIGWLGTATREGHLITIHDVFLFAQEVHATTTEITTAGLEEFANEVLQMPNGMDIWNSMKVWGHSHVNMGITPSGQDDKQMDEFKDVGHDWFIRIICNKKGEFCVDVYDYANGLVFKNAPWIQMLSEEEEALQRELFRIEAAMEELRTKGIEEKKAPVKEEMEKKVRKKTYATTTTRATTGAYSGTSSYGNRFHANSHGRYRGNIWHRWDIMAPSWEEMLRYSINIPYKDKELFKATNPDFKDMKERPNILKSEKDIYTYFRVGDLDLYSGCDDIFELDADLVDIGYRGMFGEEDLKKILAEVEISDMVGANYLTGGKYHGYN